MWGNKNNPWAFPYNYSTKTTGVLSFLDCHIMQVYMWWHNKTGSLYNSHCSKLIRYSWVRNPIPIPNVWMRGLEMLSYGCGLWRQMLHSIHSQMTCPCKETLILVYPLGHPLYLYIHVHTHNDYITIHTHTYTDRTLIIIIHSQINRFNCWLWRYTYKINSQHFFTLQCYLLIACIIY